MATWTRSFPSTPCFSPASSLPMPDFQSSGTCRRESVTASTARAYGSAAHSCAKPLPQQPAVKLFPETRFERGIRASPQCARGCPPAGAPSTSCDPSPQSDCNGAFSFRHESVLERVGDKLVDDEADRDRTFDR